MNNALTQLKEIWGRMAMGQKAVVIAAILGTIGLIGAMVVYGSQEEYSVLFSDLKPADAQSIVEKLKAENVAYQLSNGGTTVSVPSEHVAELRMQVAASGQLSGGHIGFDIFDKTRFGATDFEQQVNYQRAIEGELGRTLEQLDEIESARVHIVKSKDSLFTEKEEPAKASVMLRMRQNRPPTPERVAAIVNLVSSAVEGLAPENVSISDTGGRVLTAGNQTGGGFLGDAGRFNAHLEARRKLEDETASRVVALLEPVTGPGGVRADVSADLDFSQVDETSERYDPKSQVIRSQQSTSEVRGANSAAPGGVVGARANDPANPPAAASAGSSSASNDQRTASTTNYEIDKTTRHVVGVPGRVNRMSVSVVVDYKKISGVGTVRTPEELATLQQLVTAAVGLDTTRGDQVVVQSMAFSAPELAPVETTWLDANRELVKTGIKYGLMVFAALLLIIFVVRPARKALRAATQPQIAATERLLLEGAHDTAQDELALADGGLKGIEAVEDRVLAAAPEPKTVAELEAEMDAAIAREEKVLSPEVQRSNSLKKKLIERSQDDPEMIAMTIRGWLKG